MLRLFKVIIVKLKKKVKRKFILSDKIREWDLINQINFYYLRGKIIKIIIQKM